MLLRLVVICVCFATYVAGLTTVGKTSVHNNRGISRFRPAGLVSSTTEVATEQENENVTEYEEPPLYLSNLKLIQERLTMMTAVHELQNLRLEKIENRLTNLEIRINKITDALEDLKEGAY